MRRIACSLLLFPLVFILSTFALVFGKGVTKQMNQPQQTDEQSSAPRTRAFNPNDHVMQLKSREGSKDYLPVQWRLVWFREQCPNGTIKTKMLHLDLDRETEEDAYVWNNEKRRSEKVTKTGKGYAVFQATVKDGKGGVAKGTKSEKAASFPDFIEKAETGAIGRALAALGYGTQFAPEFNEEHRIVDAPVDRGQSQSSGQPQTQSQISANGSASTTTGTAAAPNGVAQEGEDELITPQQVSSIRKLCEHLGKAEPEGLVNVSYLNAKKLIQQLTAEYRESRQSQQQRATR